MADIEKIEGLNFYYRTLQDGSEEPCGARIDLSRISRDVLPKIVQTPQEISLTLIFDGKPAFSYSPEDLGQSPNKEKVLREVAEVAPVWCNAIIILEKGSIKPTRYSNHSK